MSVITTTNTPDTLDSTSCVLQQTTDEQINQNLAGMIQILVTALQDGTIPVANSARLQNLTVDDIIDLIIDELPSITSSIITNVDGTISNIIEMITEHQITRDSKFVNTDFLQFKIEDRINPDTDKYGPDYTIKYLVCWLPQDLSNKERIVAVYLTTKNDNNLNIINNDVIFEYDIDIDPTDTLGRYKIEIPAPKIEVGETIEFNVDNLPSTPNKWGIYSAEKFIKVTYLVDQYWVPSNDNTITAEGDFDVAKNVSSGPIPMNYGVVPNTEPNESVNIIKEIVSIVNPMDTEEIDLPKSANNINSPSWIILPEYTNIDWVAAGGEFMNFIADETTKNRLINQSPSELIYNLTEGLPQSYTAHTLLNTTANELSNVFVMPANKVIGQIIDDTIAKLELDRYINGPSSGLFDQSKIINLMLSNLIEKKVSTELAGNHAGATDTSVLFLRMMADQNEYTYIQKVYVPDRIIEEIITEVITWQVDTSNYLKTGPAVILFKELLLFTLRSTRMIYDPSRIISLLQTALISYRERSFFFRYFDRIIEQDPNEITPTIFKHNNQASFLSDGIKNKANQNNFMKYTDMVIEELENLIAIIKLNYRVEKDFNKIVEQELNSNLINLNLDDTLKLDNYDASYQRTEFPAFKNVTVKDAQYIINLKAYFPAIMTVSSSSVTYLQDTRNMKMISSMSMDEEFIPLYTAEGQQQRSTYEMIAEQDQRVFDINTNPYDTTVYREGFRLSRGDYYTNGSKIILKSGANKGEIITIISERKYTYSNNVSKEELENAIGTLKAERPILSYPALTYEQATVQIIIENFSSANVYNIEVKFDGVYRDDISYIRHYDTIYLDVPEVINARRKTIQVTVRCQETGKIQSVPTTAEINIRNLYDYVDGVEPNRLVIGISPTEWYGLQSESILFENALTDSSTFEILPVDAIGPKRIKVLQDKYIQSKVINNVNFTGTYIDPYIGLENLDSRRVPVISSSVSETIIDSTTFNQEYLEEVFANGNLWFILDASTDNAINQEFLNAVNGTLPGTTQKYAYRRANELTNSFNLLPRTTNSLYIEHNDKLKNRIIKNIIIFDIEFKIDFDFEDFAEISENGQVTKKEIAMESIEYFVQEDVPHLLIKVNSPEIPNPNNPYLNISSNILLPMVTTSLNSKQLELPDKGFAINNIYNEVIFSGLETDHSAPNQDKVIPFLKDMKKFNLGINYVNPFKNDFFVLTEEDTANTDSTGSTTKKEIYLGMVRFKTDEQVIKENILPQTRVKLFDKFLTRDKSIKCLANTQVKALATGSTYSSDFAIVEYGGYGTYLDSDNVERKVIDSVISYRRVYIQENFDIQNGVNPSSINIYDGHHVSYGANTEIKIPNYWDVVYKPSTRISKATELQYVWSLIRDAVVTTDQRWLNITDGLLVKGKYEKDISDFVGSESVRDTEVINLENMEGFLVFGGVGYKPTLTRKTSVRVTGDYINTLILANNPIASKVKWAYNTRSGTRYVPSTRVNASGNTESYNLDTDKWLDRTDVLDIYYGWENGEPYVEYHWAKSYKINHGSYTEQVLNYYVDRVSRSKAINTDIYYVSTNLIDNPYVLDDSKYSQDSMVVRKFVNVDYKKLYTDTTGASPIVITNEIYPNRTVFQDIIYESNCWWLTVRDINTFETNLYQLTFGSIPSTSSSLEFKKIYNLDTNLSKWTLTKDITSTLRGDGPILIKHVQNNDYVQGTNDNGGGIYYWDTWNNTLYNKSSTIIPASATVFGIPEISGVRNPYFLVIDYITSLNIRIDIVGTRLFLVVYLDKFISLLTKDEFNLFKEEIVHTEKLINSANPNKILRVLPNEQIVPIRAIMPDNDNYMATSAIVSFNRTETQTGRTATNLVFRLTNPLGIPLELDSVRFTTK